ncbi:MAG: hypothetical protein IKC64_05905 [Clostridia bacterium]|nr:hypothetical protein [Clostridia bacterium]
MNKVFLISALIIGTVIGAGFASGREIVAFFGFAPSPVIALAVALAVFIFTLGYLTAVKKAKATTLVEYHDEIAGRFSPVLSCVILANCAVTVSAMLSGLDALFSEIYPLKPLYSIIGGILCVTVTARGRNRLLSANGVIVPLLVFIIVAVCLSKASDFYCFNHAERILYAVPYVGLNAMLSSSAIVGEKDLTTAQSVLISLICALAIGTLTLLIILALSTGNYANASMPIVAISQENPVLFSLAFVGLGCAIFSTLISAHSVLTEWVTPVVGNRTLSSIITICACLSLSFIGFKQVVDTLYPATSILSIAYAIVTLIYLVKRPLGNGAKPSKAKRPKST